MGSTRNDEGPKNGDHYWVEANVTPIMENGKPVGYLSVRKVPSREQVRAAAESRLDPDRLVIVSAGAS